MLARMLHIFRYEFLNLFVSPIAWLMLIVFFVQASIAYIAMVETVALLHFQGFDENSITRRIFENRYVGLFARVTEYAFLYVPLLTMNLFTREVSSGSIKLLLSSPVSDWDIVLGKYFAIVSYFGLFAIYLSGLIFLTGSFVPNLSYASALLGCFGIFLLMAAYSAIGLFMSSLTRHQVVAAVSTLALLAVLSFIGTVGQRIPVFADIAYWLSSNVRIDSFIEGLFTSKDVVYFVAIAVLFVGLTYFRVIGARQARSAIRYRLSVVAFVLTISFVGVSFSSPRLTYFYDATPNDRRSPPAEIASILTEMDGPISITAYVNVLDDRATNFLPRMHRSLERRFFDEITRYNPQLKTNYVYYYGPSGNERIYARHPEETEAQLAKRFADENRLNYDRFIPVSELPEADVAEQFAYRSFYSIQYGGETVYIPTFDDQVYHPTSSQYATALQIIDRGPTYAAAASGAGERSVVLSSPLSLVQSLTAASNRFSITNTGYQIHAVSLNEFIPDQVKVLIIADPKRPYSDVEVDSFLSFIGRGGNALLLIEPDREQYVRPLLSVLGIEVQRETLSQSNRGLSESIVFVAVDRTAESSTGFDLTGFTYASDVFEEDGLLLREESVVLDGAGLLDVKQDKGFQAISFLKADPRKSSIRGRPLEKGDNTNGLLLNRSIGGIEQRIAVIADADFMSNAILQSREVVPNANRVFLLRLFRWLSNERYPILAPSTEPSDIDLNIGPSGIVVIKLVCYWLLPIILAGLAFVFLLRRWRR